MSALQKLAVFVVGFAVAFYFYSTSDKFEPEMLNGKRVIVTGASSGIGEQMAYHLAQMKSHVFITARREERLKQVVAKCLELGAASAHYVAGSMDDMAFAEHVVAEAWKTFGGLDMLILNHIGNTSFGYFDGNVDHIRKLMEINFLSYATMTVAALPMLKESGGNIVVVSSLAGKVPTPFTAAYSATKFALDGFFGTLRHELILQNFNVSVTLCVISFIDTDTAVRVVSKVIRQPPAPKQECALEIIKGGILRKREVYYAYEATKIPLLIRDWAPEYLDSLIRMNYNIENIKNPE
ncbi:corticosteroid 11-beta-dehydrogenase isozyme 1 isoform X1 [Protopterus annectens]|uniref:corticosteroid 11-beta-dehydrogenase isozyme 1 isoform X1 n=1 Tax=Protopterus annectens TaxID=7888 RepID=UPI001CFAB88D|nr:corticosteroid 11-beta-dehydrogenase isozyme 1 isoform X1 [Protopterus annectens]